MGGGISVKSELGEGSCFSIRVLAWMNSEQSTEDAVGAALQLGNSMAI
jgi:hypothetical protein